MCHFILQLQLLEKKSPLRTHWGFPLRLNILNFPFISENRETKKSSVWWKSVKTLLVLLGLLFKAVVITPQININPILTFLRVTFWSPQYSQILEIEICLKFLIKLNFFVCFVFNYNLFSWKKTIKKTRQLCLYYLDQDSFFRRVSSSSN